MKKHNNVESYLQECVMRDQVPKPDPAKKERTIHYLRDVLQIDTMRMNSMDFIKGQFRFIHKRTWILQILSLMIFYLLIRSSKLAYIPYQNYIWASIVAPVICILAVEEMVRIYHPGMLELEMTTKHSLRQVMLSRFLTLGGTDFIMILIFNFFTVGTCKSELLQFSVYTIIPFLLVTAIMLGLMNFLNGERLQFSFYSICMIGIAMLLINRNRISGFYASENLHIWIVLGVVSILFCFYELVNMKVCVTNTEEQI